MLPLSKFRHLIFISLLISNFSTTKVLAQNVGINGTGANPNVSSMLDVDSDDKGLLIPRVNIIDLTTAAPVTLPASSLLVYNTNATSGVGYYFWDGTKWTKIKDINSNADHDWYEVGGTNDPDAINDNIFTQGNVGIGLNNPQSQLSILNNNNIGTNTDGLDNSILYLNNGSASDGSIIIKSHNVSNGNAIGSLKFHSSPDATNYSSSSIKALAGLNGRANTLAFYTSQNNMQANAPDEVMRIENDFVGIGTQAPVSKLHVHSQSGDTKVTIEADPTNTVEQDNPSLEFIQDGELIKGSISLLQDGGTGLLGTAVVNRGNSNAMLINTFANNPSIHNGKLDLATLDTVRMSITGIDGNVGIGINNPNYQLDIYEDDQTFALGIFNNNDQAGNGILIESNGASNDDTLIDIRGDLNGIPRDILTVIGDGRMGINTGNPNPITKLDVDGYMIGQNFLFSTYSGNEVANFPNGVVSFAEVSDPNNNFAANTYTAPVAGYYYFSTNISFDGGDGVDDTMFLNFVKNGVATNALAINPRFISTTDGLEANYSHSAIISLAAGDTVSVSITNVNSSIVDYISRNFMGYMISK